MNRQTIRAMRRAKEAEVRASVPRPKPLPERVRDLENAYGALIRALRAKGILEPARTEGGVIRP